MVMAGIDFETPKGEIPKRGVFIYHVFRPGILFNEVGRSEVRNFQKIFSDQKSSRSNAQY